MIKHVTITDPSRTGIEWWGKVPALKDITTLKFNPGVTILWGRNGCGKSTLLKAVARKLHCEQGGVIKVTQNRRSWDVPDDGLDIVHDGQILYVAPEQQVGLIGGTFDYDFMDQGVEEAMAKGSSGQHVLRRMGHALGVIVGQEKLAPVQHKVEISPELKKFLDGSFPKFIPTVLLDEPDRSLDLVKQAGFYRNLLANSLGRAQVIIATHCPFAANLPGVTYVDLQPGYLEECRAVIKKLA